MFAGYTWKLATNYLNFKQYVNIALKLKDADNKEKLATEMKAAAEKLAKKLRL